MQPIFITGIGTGIGKTVIAAIIAEALQAGYWKPVQAGYTDGTDSEWVRQSLSNSISKIYPETYKLQMAASPHIAARVENLEIDLDKITAEFASIQDTRNKAQEGKSNVQNPISREAFKAQGTRHKGEYPIFDTTNDFLIIEGAGGLLVPLNDREFVIDLVKKLHAKVILVSRNYLGSINHSLLTSSTCKQHGLDVLGWIFNDQYFHYEDEIVQWSGFPKIATIPFSPNPDKAFIHKQAQAIREALLREMTVDR